MTKHDRDLLNIANEELFYFLAAPRANLEARMNDEEDFMDLAIWDIKRALEKAYQLGRSDEKKTERRAKR